MFELMLAVTKYYCYR